MKYKLYGDIDSGNNILHHLLFSQPTEFWMKVLDSQKDIQPFTDRTVDIEVKINGEEIDPKAFFDMLWDNYANMIEKEAVEIISAKTTDKIEEISTKLRDFQEILVTWNNTINWDVQNPFQK